MNTTANEAMNVTDLGAENIPSETPSVPSEAQTAPPVERLTALHLSVSLDGALYALFAAIALVMRLINLSTIVLNDTESHEALAVFRAINPAAPGSLLISHQPFPFAANALVMAIGGDNNVTARLATVLVGVGIVLMPILYRRWIGRTGALIASGLLTISPVLLTASRTMSGSVWSIGLALLGVWLVGSFVETRRSLYAIAATISLTLLTVATESAGFLVTIMLVAGLVSAFALDFGESNLGARLREGLRAWPWPGAVAASVIALALIGTVFWLYPQNLSTFGDTLATSLRGFLFRPAQNPIAFPLLTSLLYEPVLWVFGAIGVWWVLHGLGGFMHRALLGWLVAGIVLCLVYPGAGAEDALWLTIPLVGLSALALEVVLTPIADRFWIVPLWGPWLHGLGVLAILSLAAINLVEIGQDILKNPASLTPSLEQPLKVVYLGLAIALAVILYFLVGSVWGNKAAWRGTAIGVLAFLSIYSLSGGWHASVVNADDPREFWRTRPVSQNLLLLQSELTDTTLRASGMRNTMPLTVVGPDDSPIAWLIRDYEKVTYVSQPSATINTPAVLIPSELDKPQLGAAYVGQPFTVYEGWDRTSMQDWDFIPWLYDRTSRIAPTADSRITLWVRSDVYGVPADTLNPSSGSAATGK